MSYIELKKISYKNSSSEYAKIYLQRFNSEEAQRLNFYIGKNQAFFVQNIDVMKLACNIARLDKEIGKLCQKLPGVAIGQYTQKCLIDEIVITNKIEGVRSSRKEIDEALDVLLRQSDLKGKRNRFGGLINKYLKLISGEELSLKNCQDIRNIYNEVFLEEVISENAKNVPDGKFFRKEAASVYDESDRIIHNGLNPESKIIDSMQQALYFLNDESVDELFRVCLFHYLIEYIHPFYDGNGRLGRFLFSYSISHILEPIIAFRISETIKNHISAYYKAFKTCNDQRNLGDLTPFLLMQLNMLFVAMTELKESLEKRLATWKRYEEAIKDYCSDGSFLHEIYSYLIQAALFSEKGISMKELEQETSLSKYKINRLLCEIPSNLMCVKTKSNFKYYSIDLNELNNEIVQREIKAISNKAE